MNNREDRPVIKLSATPMETILDVASLCVLILMGLYVANAWESLPELVPMHFGPSGAPDDWGAKTTIWLLPALSLVTFGALKIMKRLPHTFNYPFPITDDNAEVEYRLARSMTSWLIFWTELLFGVVVWAQVRISFGQMTGLGLEYMGPVMVALFGTLGYYLYRMYRER